MDDTPEILAENDVSPDEIRNIFKAAFMKVRIDDDGDVEVVYDGLKCFVSVDKDKKMIKLVAVFGLKEDAPESDKLELINTLNDEVVFTRFSTPRPDVLVADYFLLFEEGIMPFQVVQSLRVFTKVTQWAIREHDTKDVVE